MFDPGIEVVAPNMAEQLLTRQDLALVGKEGLEEQELLPRQFHRFPGPFDTSTGDVNGQVAQLEFVSPSAGPVSRSRERILAKSSSNRKGLGMKSLAPRSSPATRVSMSSWAVRMTTGILFPSFAELGQDREAVHSREPEVEDDQVERRWFATSRVRSTRPRQPRRCGRQR